MRLEGVVRRIELYGAFIDIGMERDGLVHISQLSDRRVDRVSDVIKEGDRVTVWVTEVDPDRGRVGLAMVKPPDLPWKDLAEGQVYNGRIVRIERYGVFVDIGAERPGLLHVREMGSQFIRHPSDMYREQDPLTVRILQLDRRKRRIDLTLEETVDAAPDDTEEELPTPVELAFRKAREEVRAQQRGPSKKRKRYAEQDDIMQRTLQQHAE